MIEFSKAPQLGRPVTPQLPSQKPSTSVRVERAKLWRNQNIAGVELFQGDFLKYSFTRHFHSVIAFGAVEAGLMRYWHRDRTCTIGQNTLMLFNPGEVHAPIAANDERWSFRMFYLADSLFQRLSQQISDRPIRFTAPFNSDPAVAQMLFGLHRELEGRCEGIEFESRILEILEQLARRHSEARDIRRMKAVPASVARMREYIHAYSDTEVSLAALADVGQLSMFHALRSFRDVLGLPPHKYLLQVRVERAKALLHQGRSISDTAALLGFADQSHLNRHYKRMFGVAPAESLRELP